VVGGPPPRGPGAARVTVDVVPTEELDPREPQCRIEAADAAVAALDRLRVEHGDVLLHLPGGAEDAGTPTCLPVGELRIGAADVYLGSVHGVDVYEQRSLPGRHYRTGWVVSLDLVPGMPPGFSLRPGDGMRFAIRDHREE
jgi:uncharacterized protein